MKFCTRCGTKLEENKRFCTKCGAAVSNGPINSTNELEEVQKIKETQDLKMELNDLEKINIRNNLKNSDLKKEIKLNKSQKRTSIIVAIILVLGFTCYKIGENATSKEKVITKFTEAITARDANKMAKYVVSSDSRLKINSESLGAFFDYMDKNPSYANEIISSIEKQSSKVNVASKLNNEKNNFLDGLLIENSDNSIFTLKKLGKKWGLYDNYVLEVKPIYMNLSINLKDVKILNGEELVATSDSDNFTKQVGPFIPGIYKLKATYKGRYTNLEKTEEVELIGTSTTNEFNVPIDLKAHYVRINAEPGYEDAKLFVNGHDENILIREASNLGPVDSSTKLYAVKNVNGKEVKAQEVVVGDESSIYLEFPKEISQNENSDKGSYKPPVFNTITASSKLVESNYNYDPINVADGNKETVWVEGASGDGLGEWVKLESDTEQGIVGFSVINGYSKSDNLYYANNRVAKLLVEFSDGTSTIFNLTDRNFNEQGVTFTNIKKTKYVKFTIMEVYNGSKYSDTCISEIRVF
jgi:uncharacterized membrane protein YvbJ